MSGKGANERPLSIRGMLRADPGQVSFSEEKRAR